MANISNLAHKYHTYQPSQTLACSYQKHLISYGIISWSRWNIGMATSKHTSYPRQKTNLGIIKQTCYCISLLKEKDKQTNLIHVHHPNKIIFKSMHVHVNACLTSLTSLHHKTYGINACSWY